MARPERLDPVLLSPSRAGATDFPWPDGVLGACTALRGDRLPSTRTGRFVVLLLALPLALLDLSHFPGSKRLLARFSPIGYLAYGPEIAALGFQYNGIFAQRVHIDWVDRPVEVSLLSTGRVFSSVSINGRRVFVDRRYGDALVHLWARSTIGGAR